jgi:TolB protein
VAAGAALLMACGRAQAVPSPSPSPAAAAAGSGAAARYDMVYERTVDGNQDLYLIPAGGGKERRLTDDPATDALPRFTRDGKAILFGSERGGNWQLYEIPAAGGAARRLRSNTAREWQLDGSPDGREVAFLSNLEGPESLFVLLRGGEARRLVRHGRNSILGNPTWSPDGRLIVFSSNWRLGHHIYVVGADGSGERRISPLRAGGCEPRFSPDGRKVLHVSRGHLSEHSRLVEHDLGSGAERVLVSWPALNYNPVYAPDGSEVAFTSNITGEWVIYRQRLSDGQAWRVTYGPGAARAPDYRP